MLSSISACRRRLGVGVGALLAAGALALPAAAPASVVVKPAKMAEGNSGQQRSPWTDVETNCDKNVVGANGYCIYWVNWAVGMTASFGEDMVEVWQLPHEFKLPAGQTNTFGLAVDVLGDTKPEPDEQYNIVVNEALHVDTGRVESTPEVYLAGIIEDDDGEGNPGATGDAQYENWDLGQQCQTADAVGTQGAHDAWAFFVDGCTAKVTCPENRSCTAHTESSIYSDGDEHVSLNQRTRVLRGGEPVWSNEVSCDEGASQCTAKDDTPTFSGGETFEVQCDGVHARQEHVANVLCQVDVEYE